MFGKDGLFRSRSKASEVTQLNLDRAPVQRPAPPSTPAPQPSIAEAHTIPINAQAMIESTVRQLLETGVNTALVSYILNPTTSSPFTLSSPLPAAKRPIPLFSSPLLALDFINAHRINFSAATISIEQLPMLADSWRVAGIDSFVFNCCPRCPVANFLTPQNGTITQDQIRLAWVTYRVLRQWRGQRALQTYLEAKSDIAAQRATLEFVRDHIDYANPYIHWLIAIYAGIQGDEACRLASTARLELFGPVPILQQMLIRGR